MTFETLYMTNLGTVLAKYSNTGIETWNHTNRPEYKKEGLAAIHQNKNNQRHGIRIEFKYKNGTYIWNHE